MYVGKRYPLLGLINWSKKYILIILIIDTIPILLYKSWLKALTYQLRLPKPWEHSAKVEILLRKEGNVHHDTNHFENIQPYITSSEYAYIMTKGNKASHLLSLQSKEFLILKQNGQIDDFRHMELEKMLG